MSSPKTKDPWKIIVFIISVLFIVFMWVKKDLVSIYATMPREQLLPLIMTTILVSLIKVAAVAGGILLLKFVIGKIKKQ